MIITATITLVCHGVLSFLYFRRFAILIHRYNSNILGAFPEGFENIDQIIFSVAFSNLLSVIMFISELSSPGTSIAFTSCLISLGTMLWTCWVEFVYLMKGVHNG